MQNELAQLQTDLVFLEKQLPKDKDIPNILRTLSREAIQENLQFVRLVPKPAVQQQYFEILPFDLQFTGNLQSFVRFLASLGQQERIFQAQNIQLTLGSGPAEALGNIVLSINLTIQTYAYAG
jgi:Tfp pilus assembly protein PilO